MWKKGQALVPTWTAFAVVGLLEQHFDELVDYAFTARIETTSTRSPAASAQKDAVAARRSTSATTTLPGLKRLVEENLDEIDAAGDQHVPDRRRPRRQRDRRQARQVRART